MIAAIPALVESLASLEARCARALLLLAVSEA
jgi:hypothetical protein